MRHCITGPAKTNRNGSKFWYFEGELIWSSYWSIIDLKKKIILSKEPHPKHPTIQVWKWIDENGIREQVMIPEMEERFIE